VIEAQSSRKKIKIRAGFGRARVHSSNNNSEEKGKAWTGLLLGGEREREREFSKFPTWDTLFPSVASLVWLS
jgi:hypothetical protein